MPAQPAPPPPVAPETCAALLAAAADFAALEPWAFASDAECVGLTDPVSGGTRIGHVLGNAGEVFAAVFYRRDGVRWILAMLSDAPDPGDLNTADGMDCLKLELVPRRELEKADLAPLKDAGFKPAGKGCVWPQFRSSDPGWHPWFINQAEAEQLLADLPRLTAFLKLFERAPDLFEGRAATEIPFLPRSLPERPLAPEDLDWQPLLPPPPAGFPAFQASAEHLAALAALPQEPALACEFDCTLLPGGSFLEQGRPCYGRFGLLVEQAQGLLLGVQLVGGHLPPGEAAGRCLVQTLLAAGRRPMKLLLRGPRLQPVLQPLCDALDIELHPLSSLPLLDEALDHLGRQMLLGPGPRRG